MCLVGIDPTIITITYYPTGYWMFDIHTYLTVYNRYIGMFAYNPALLREGLKGSLCEICAEALHLVKGAIGNKLLKIKQRPIACLINLASCLPGVISAAGHVSV